jgi:hypothetical protein
MIAVFFYCNRVVLHLWNWLLPPFGWRKLPSGKRLDCWPSAGFSSVVDAGGRDRSGFQADGRSLEQMTPEEQEKFRQGMRSRCGSFGEPAGGASEPA